MLELIESTFIVLLLLTLIFITIIFMIVIYRAINMIFFFKKIKNKISYFFTGVSKNVDSSIEKISEDMNEDSKTKLTKIGKKFDFDAKLKYGNELIKKTKKFHENFFSAIYKIIIYVIIFMIVMTLILGVNIAFYLQNHTEYTSIFTKIFHYLTSWYR